MTTTDGNCPACQLSGVTPERALKIAPAYMTALRAAKAARAARTNDTTPWIPDGPAGWCWDCRTLAAEGHDPATLVAADDERQRLSDDLAHWSGQDAEREHDAEYVRADLQHGTYCCGAAREDGARNMHAFALQLPLADLRRRHEAERSGRPVPRDVTDALLIDVCTAARTAAEQRAAARGDIPADVRRAGLEAERCERSAHHFGQAPDVAMRETLIVRLRHLSEIEPPQGWQRRAEGRAMHEGVI